MARCGSLSFGLLRGRIGPAYRTSIVASPFEDRIGYTPPLALTLRRLGRFVMTGNVACGGPGHGSYPRFLAERLPGFFSASRTAWRRNPTGWERASKEGVSSLSGTARLDLDFFTDLTDFFIYDLLCVGGGERDRVAMRD